MNFLSRFLGYFATIWLVTVIAFLIFSLGWSFISQQNLDIIKDRSFWLLIGIIPVIVGLIIGLASAFGWDGKP